MSYTINRFNGAQITVVADGTIDATLDLKLIGKNYAGYGSVQNENFVYLLENFANTNPPPRPISGQIWFDSSNSKLKFYDGAKFRTTGGAEISATPPTGLTVGDFWFDTVNQQLSAWNGNGFTLIGPQGVAGSATTQMRSVSVLDTNNAPHAIIQAIDNGQTIFIISSDADFTLNTAVNDIAGFTKIHQGVTLCYTNNDVTQLGQTTSNHRFWGTATNADKLGGLSASAFVQAGNANFSTLTNFADVGFTVGNPTPRLKVYNDSAITPTIINQAGDTIVFQTTVSSNTKTPLVLKGTDILPGSTLISSIGSSSLIFNEVYANSFKGTADQSNKLNNGTGTYVSANTDKIANTIAARDAQGNLVANIFQGTASAANYADLAENYLPDASYDVGTVMVVGGAFEVTESSYGDRAIGVISEKPAYLMNKDLTGGVAVALKGRVPVKVIGPITKGQTLVASNNGTAIAVNSDSFNVFAVALESNSDESVKLVECVIL